MRRAVLVTVGSPVWGHALEWTRGWLKLMCDWGGVLQRQLYDVWMKTSELRTSVAMQRIKLQQARQAHKLRSILSTHVSNGDVCAQRAECRRGFGHERSGGGMPGWSSSV